MHYLKLFAINFLTVFFADHILPGLEVTDMTRLPHIGSDLIFSLSLGLLNSIIYYGLKVLRQHPSVVKIALLSLIINFGAYGLLRFLPLAIVVKSLEGYLLAAGIVSIVSFVTNFLELKKHRHSMPTL